METPKQPVVRALAFVLAVVSVIAAILVGNLAVASHLPFSVDLESFSKLVELTGSRGRNWRAIHVLAAGCRCSRGVAEHLATRGSFAGLHESVLLLGTDREITRLICVAKLPVRVISATEASERYHVEGAPWLIVFAPDNSIRYAGGYSSDRSARAGYQDAEIWKAISSGRDFRPLPAFGCAVSRRIRKAIDPLGLKYTAIEGNS